MSGLYFEALRAFIGTRRIGPVNNGKIDVIHYTFYSSNKMSDIFRLKIL